MTVGYARFRRRAAHNPAKPTARTASVAGSGTGIPAVGMDRKIR